MEINDKPVTAMDLLNLAFIGTAIEPHLDRIEEEKAPDFAPMDKKRRLCTDPARL